MKQRALLIGINKYTSSIGSLRGSVNDVELIEHLITKHYDFVSGQDIKKLVDEQATTQNILSELDLLVADAQPGDVLFLYYSGHGAQILNEGNDLEEDGYDEILCPIDVNWKDKVINDDQLQERFKRVPAGVNLTVILDCCYSGGNNDGQPIYDPRLLTEQTASTTRFARSPLYENVNIKSRRKMTQDLGAAIMISACREDQLAHEALIETKVYGVATSFMVKILTNNEFDLDYQQLIEKTAEDISTTRFFQDPVLSGPEQLFRNKFLKPFV
jgi:hypothetical protein